MTLATTTAYHPTPAGRLFAVAAGAGRPVICLHGITANVDFDGQQIRNPQQNKRLYDILQAFKG